MGLIRTLASRTGPWAWGPLDCSRTRVSKFTAAIYFCCFVNVASTDITNIVVCSISVAAMNAVSILFIVRIIFLSLLL